MPKTPPRDTQPSPIPPFSAYVEDRKYLRNVTEKTLSWFKDAWKAFGPHIEPALAQGALSEGLRAGITALREKGVRPVSINSYLTCVRAYLNWLHAEGHLVDKPRVPLLKCERKVIATLSPEQIGRLMSFRPAGVNQTRTHIASCLLLDTGLRLAEALCLTRRDVDLDDCLLTVLGKGRKERRVPISLEMRGRLFKWFKGAKPEDLVFGTRNGIRVSNRNFQRDLKGLCRKVKIDGPRCSPHTLRHSFSVGYLRAGGNLYYLSRILGHTSVKTTERYLQSLGVEDLQAVHDRLSPLARRQV